MERHVFDKSNYLVTFYYPFDGEFDCYACGDRSDVFRVLTDVVRTRLSWVREDEPEFIESLNEDDIEFLNMLDSVDCLTNPEIIAEFFEEYCGDDNIRYRVTDGYGKALFSYHC